MPTITDTHTNHYLLLVTECHKIVISRVCIHFKGLDLERLIKVLSYLILSLSLYLFLFLAFLSFKRILKKNNCLQNYGNLD